MKKTLKTALGCASLLFLLTGCTQRESFETFKQKVEEWRRTGTHMYESCIATVKGTAWGEEYNFTYESLTSLLNLSENDRSVATAIFIPYSINNFISTEINTCKYYVGDGNFFSPKFMIKAEAEEGTETYTWNANLNITKIKNSNFDLKISYIYKYADHNQ